ncbi:MAG: DNA polymerase III subunit beta [Candidatus Gastranaerophilales bacterium]|nr:DNA polymerase III subunit beta [Candidatus Gastranaerophilales bacterium]
MKFNIEKNDLMQGLRMVEKITVQRGIQPVLANILIEAVDGRTLKFTSTDLDILIEGHIKANIQQEGSITLPAKKLLEIVSKLPDKTISFVLGDNNIVEITCGNSKFDVVGIDAAEFPTVLDEELLNSPDKIDVEIKPFLKAVKQTVFATASNESNNILSGVYCKIINGELEMAATDGNRLSRVIEKITTSEDKDVSVVIPSKTLNELVRLISDSEDKKFYVVVKKGQILFQLDDRVLLSRLLEGQYPKYQLLIPEKGDKHAIVDREELISAIDRASTMVNERTSIVKFTFSDNKLLLKADTSDVGSSMDLVEIEYKEEELIIAFNYKYVLEALKIMDSEKVRVDLSSALSATLFKPVNEENYICLVMPVQVR